MPRKTKNTLPTTFGLIRHSLTRWNEEKRIQGLRNSPLSATGRTMAASWAEELRILQWNRIVASDLGRVRETAALINNRLQLPLTTDPLLREQDWGCWSGLTFPELFARYGEEVRQQEQAGWHFRPPGGESRDEVLARAIHALENFAHRWPAEKILVICHEGIIKTLIYHLLQRKFLPDEPRIFTGYHLHLLEVAEKKITLTGFNFLELTGKDA